jgi:deaminated glutathione amidase
VVAPSQCGETPDGRLARYGHSLIVAPWGETLADGGEDAGVIAADLDLALVVEARRMIPALRHDRVFEVQTIGES